MCVVWMRKIHKQISPIVNRIAARYDVEVEPTFFATGSFNYCYKATVNEQLDLLFRFPILGKSAFRYEKTDDESAIIAYISRYTSIPVPKVFAVEDSPVGPFIAMNFVQGTLLSKHLQTPSDSQTMSVLSPEVRTSTLTKAYHGMAGILVELAKCRFTHIGGLKLENPRNWRIGKRPCTLNMNTLVAQGNYPTSALPEHEFSTANDYFTALANMHIVHLRSQRNDAVENEEDCRKKFIARYLFLKIARNFSTVHNNGPFPLFCDDFRPSNVIVNSDLNVRSIIDWEYCYAAPVELTYCSPWWLLLARPEDWKDGLDAFLEQYLPRQQLFLKVLREYEDMAIQRGDLIQSQRLSDNMAQSLSNGSFWFCAAATSSFGFDDIYWRFIDPTYHGKFKSIEDRVALLNLEEQMDLEPSIRLKMQEAAERTLDEHRSLDTILAA
ncbi:MAG: hypothetical protein Q9160_001256 [Pyrenula sp. 1 TL-2023]